MSEQKMLRLVNMLKDAENRVLLTSGDDIPNSEIWCEFPLEEKTMSFRNALFSLCFLILYKKTECELRYQTLGQTSYIRSLSYPKEYADLVKEVLLRQVEYIRQSMEY